MAAQRFVAVVGARVLPERFAAQVAAVVHFLVARGFLWGLSRGSVFTVREARLCATSTGSRRAQGIRPRPVG